MSSFTREPQLRQTGKMSKRGLPEWEVMEGFSYFVGGESSEWEIKIPIGFKTDFASIPRFARWILSPADPMYSKAAIVHDYLDYDIHPFIRHAVFMEAMRCKNRTPIRIAIIQWLVVMLFNTEKI